MRACIALAAVFAVPIVFGTNVEADAANDPEPFGPEWSITENQHCKVWNFGQPEASEPFTWSGSCVDGKASGEGKLTHTGGIYDGAMQAGRFHGFGVQSLDGVGVYVGPWIEGVPHGFGTLLFAGGDLYQGNWHGGRAHGHGTFTLANGDVYEGQWRDGCFGERHGPNATIGTSRRACGFN